MRPDVCQNGATCHNTEGGYSCICVNDYEGHNCEINIDHEVNEEPQSCGDIVEEYMHTVMKNRLENVRTRVFVF